MTDSTAQPILRVCVPPTFSVRNFISDEEAGAFVSTCEGHFNRSLAGTRLRTANALSFYSQHREPWITQGGRNSWLSVLRSSPPCQALNSCAEDPPVMRLLSSVSAGRFDSRFSPSPDGANRRVRTGRVRSSRTARRARGVRALRVLDAAASCLVHASLTSSRRCRCLHRRPALSRSDEQPVLVLAPRV
eukprot:6180070-Pleurochrysis_carterae.AAC.4